MDYYEEKAKDSTEQAVILIWMVIIVTAVVTWYCTCKWLTHKCPEPQQPRIMSTIELQEAKISSPAESQQQLKDAGYYHGRIDGIWGPNTERAYCDYMANRLWPK